MSAIRIVPHIPKNPGPANARVFDHGELAAGDAAADREAGLAQPSLLTPPGDGSPTASPRVIQRPVARSIMDLRADPPAGVELLCSRLLFRKEGAMLIGGTGAGKSVFAIGAAMAWGCGRGYLGIRPAAPLRVVIIESEDVEWTNAFMRDGALAAMGELSEEERGLIADNVLLHEERCRCGQQFFAEVAAPLCEEHKPDLVFINPAFSYLSGDSQRGGDVGEFLRAGVNPLVEQFDCGALVFHHSNKLPGIESDRWKDFNPTYAASGHNEWSNWPRMNLTMVPTRDRDVIALVASKRPKAAGWRDDEGVFTDRQFIRRSDDPHRPAWFAVDPADAPTGEVGGAPPKLAATDVLRHVPEEGRIAKARLVEAVCTVTGAGEKRVARMVGELVEAGKLYESTKPRAGVRPEMMVSLQPHLSHE